MYIYVCYAFSVSKINIILLLLYTNSKIVEKTAARRYTHRYNHEQSKRSFARTDSLIIYRHHRNASLHLLYITCARAQKIVFHTRKIDSRSRIIIIIIIRLARIVRKYSLIMYILDISRAFFVPSPSSCYNVV